MNARGFTLVEVLVASLIIMVGVTGFVALQSEYMKTDAKLNLRTVALQLAQEKVDDLRQFDVLEVTAGTAAFNDIVTNDGGSINAGDVAVNLNSGTNRQYTFNRSWTVTNQYYIDTDADGAADTWLNEGDAGVPSPAPDVAGKKLVTVSVSWTDNEGDLRAVSLDSSIAPVPPSRSFQANNESDSAKIQPKVNYTPGQAPDVISYDLGNGESIETSKPVPEIDNRGDNTVVQFETIRYIDIPGQTDKLEQEDFLTVNCSCELAGEGTGATPSMSTFDGTDLVVKPGEQVRKMTGRPVGNQQPAICTQCCNDHHDTADMISNEQYFREESSGGPHKHYKRQSDWSFTTASAVGDEYDEVCRFKRIDGYFAIYPDWELIDVIEFSDRYLLDATKLTNYTNYTESVVSASVRGVTKPSKPADRNMTVAPGAYQLIARGIYLDRMTSSHITALKDMITNGRADWKAFVPFYDVNLTLLANWQTSQADVATITNEDIETIFDPVNNYYGTYSRGRIEALKDGSATIGTAAMAHNAGITGSGAISPDELSGAQVDASLALTVNSRTSSEKFYGLIGNINCQIEYNGTVQACETNNTNRSTYVDLTRLSITNSPSQFNCPITIPRGRSTPFFSCTNVSENWRGSIIFAFTKAGYNVTLKVQQPDGTIVATDRITLTSGLPATSNQEYNLIIELTPM